MTQPVRACSVVNCGRRHHRRGYCAMHAERVAKFGSTELPSTPPKPTCSIDGCDSVSMTRGLCCKHYTRWHRHGSVAGREPSSDIEYRAAHTRVSRARGKAAEHRCVDCSGPAYDWSYVGRSDREQISVLGRPYSTDPNDYEPRCRPCHVTHDNAEARTA